MASIPNVMDLYLDAAQRGANAPRPITLETLLDPGSRVTVAVPDDASFNELLESLRLCCEAADFATRTQRKLSPVIGRILMLIENDRKFTELGYATMDEFICRYVRDRLGYGRSSAYESMRLVRACPSLTLAKWELIGSEKLRVLAKFTREGEKSYTAYLKAAEDAESVHAFTEWAHARGLVDSSESQRKSTLVIEVIRAIKAQWTKFIRDARVHSIVGSDRPDRILEALLQEASGTWFVAAEEEQTLEPPPVPIQEPVAEPEFLEWLWRCPRCKITGELEGPKDGASLHHLTDKLYTEHKHLSKFCPAQHQELILSYKR